MPKTLECVQLFSMRVRSFQFLCSALRVALPERHICVEDFWIRPEYSGPTRTRYSPKLRTCRITAALGSGERHMRTCSMFVAPRNLFRALATHPLKDSLHMLLSRFLLRWLRGAELRLRKTWLESSTF